MGLVQKSLSPKFHLFPSASQKIPGAKIISLVDSLSYRGVQDQLEDLDLIFDTIRAKTKNLFALREVLLKSGKVSTLFWGILLTPHLYGDIYWDILTNLMLGFFQKCWIYMDLTIFSLNVWQSEWRNIVSTSDRFKWWWGTESSSKSSGNSGEVWPVSQICRWFLIQVGIDHATYGAYKIFHPCVPTSEFDTSRANNTQFQAKSKDRWKWAEF